MKTIIATLLIAVYFPCYAQQTTDPAKLIQYDRNKAAAELLHHQLQNNPSDAILWYMLAKTYVNEKNLNEGLDRLQAAPPALLLEPFYQVAKGMLLLETNRTAEANQLFEAALDETKRKNASILAAIASAHISSKHGNYPFALELLEKAIRRDKKNAEHYILKGNAYRMLHKGSEAYVSYQEALRKDPGSAEANYQLALIFLTQNNNDLAIEYLDKSIRLDPNDPRPLYELYRHFFATDPAKSLRYFELYSEKTDKDHSNDYALTDLLYLNKNYEEAIGSAVRILEAEEVPRIYKLLAYSYLGLEESSQAKSYMQKYFSKEADSNLVVKDFETMAALYSYDSKPDSALMFMEKAVAQTEGSKNKVRLYKELASVAKSASKYTEEAKWLGQYYANTSKASNVDLFNWGLAHYQAKEYKIADSVFQMYVHKYPAQSFGYYWRARSKAAIDFEMKEGLAVPHYQELIAVLKADTTDREVNTKWMVEAYGYLAAYEANVNNDYRKAVEHFKNLLSYDPDNKDAEKYVAILEKRIENADGSK